MRIKSLNDIILRGTLLRLLLAALLCVALSQSVYARNKSSIDGTNLAHADMKLPESIPLRRDPANGESLVSLAIASLVVVLVGGVGILVLRNKRFQNSQMRFLLGLAKPLNPSKTMDLLKLSSLHLDPKNTLYHIRWKDSEYLISSSENGVVVLDSAHTSDEMIAGSILQTELHGDNGNRDGQP